MPLSRFFIFRTFHLLTMIILSSANIFGAEDKTDNEWNEVILIPEIPYKNYQVDSEPSTQIPSSKRLKVNFTVHHERVDVDPAQLTPGPFNLVQFDESPALNTLEVLEEQNVSDQAEPDEQEARPKQKKTKKRKRFEGEEESETTSREKYIEDQLKLKKAIADIASDFADWEQKARELYEAFIPKNCSYGALYSRINRLIKAETDPQTRDKMLKLRNTVNNIYRHSNQQRQILTGSRKTLLEAVQEIETPVILPQEAGDSKVKTQNKKFWEETIEKLIFGADLGVKKTYAAFASAFDNLLKKKDLDPVTQDKARALKNAAQRLNFKKQKRQQEESKALELRKTREKNHTKLLKCVEKHAEYVSLGSLTKEQAVREILKEVKKPGTKFVSLQIDLLNLGKELAEDHFLQPMISSFKTEALRLYKEKKKKEEALQLLSLLNLNPVQDQ